MLFVGFFQAATQLVGGLILVVHAHGNGKGETAYQSTAYAGYNARPRGSTAHSSSILELIGRDRVDHQLYPGTFTYSGPRCGFGFWVKQHNQQRSTAVVQQEGAESYGPFSESRRRCFRHHITNAKDCSRPGQPLTRRVSVFV